MRTTANLSVEFPLTILQLLEHHLAYSSKFDDVEQKLANNQVLCNAIVHNALKFYGVEMEEVQKHIRDTEATGQTADKISVSQALKHIVRDWTQEGQHERNSTFSCMLESLGQLFPERDGGAEPVQILLPGAGLGRLGHDIHRLGGTTAPRAQPKTIEALELTAV